MAAGEDVAAKRKPLAGTPKRFSVKRWLRVLKPTAFFDAGAVLLLTLSGAQTFLRTVSRTASAMIDVWRMAQAASIRQLPAQRLIPQWP